MQHSGTKKFNLFLRNIFDSEKFADGNIFNPGALILNFISLTPKRKSLTAL